MSGVLYYCSTGAVCCLFPRLLPPLICVKPTLDAIFEWGFRPKNEPPFSGGGRPQNDIRKWKPEKSPVSGLKDRKIGFEIRIQNRCFKRWSQTHIFRSPKRKHLLAQSDCAKLNRKTSDLRIRRPRWEDFGPTSNDLGHEIFKYINGMVSKFKIMSMQHAGAER